ncbi:hypothetical protein EWB00_003535 [Schistosoma japonicum]|uniref:TIR domain-containing protein n=2 Tax=Schistosoma japonicum TaxID=6182 RepID=A0A4Z2D851_SCHJA|nr:hypothetical protein EWB00_003535 [Schistosoma japonicum]
MSTNDLGELFEETSVNINRLIQLSNSKMYDTEEFEESLQSFHLSYKPDDTSVEMTKYRTKVAVDILSKPPVFINLVSIYRELGRMAIPLSYFMLDPLPHDKWVPKLTKLQHCLSNYMTVSISFTRKLIKSDIYLTEVRRILYLAKTMKMTELVCSLVDFIISGLNTALRYENEFITQRLKDYSIRTAFDRFTCRDPKIKLAVIIFQTFTYTDIDQLHLKDEEIDLFLNCFNYSIDEGIESGDLFRAFQFNKVLRILALNRENRNKFIKRDVVKRLKLLPDSLPHCTEEISLTIRILSSELPNDDAIVEMRSLAMEYCNSVSELEEEVGTFCGSCSDDEYLPQYPSEHEDSDVDESPTDVKEENTNRFDGHIMISYSHDDQKMALRIKERLEEEDIKIWIDKDHMVQEVRILDAMANAVQNAAIVLILFSKSYQDGENTKAEAEYTRKLKKPSIFLRVEPGFAPDSWLGFMIGESRYIDFSGKYPFEEKFKELCTTIHNISRGTITMERVKPIKTKENLCVAM